MYLNTLLSITLVINIPNCYSACDKYYIILNEHFDKDFGVNMFEPILSNSPDMNVTFPQNFNINCILDLECKGIVGDCPDTLTIHQNYGIDERYTTIDSIIYDSTKEYGNDNVDENSNDTENYITTDPNNSKEITTTPNVNANVGIDASLLDKNNATLDVSDTTAKSDSDEDFLSNDITTNTNASKEIATSESLLNKNNATLGKSGKLQESKETDTSNGSKIAAGIIGGAAAIVLAVALKNIVLNWLHSGTYHIPEGNR